MARISEDKKLKKKKLLANSLVKPLHENQETDRKIILRFTELEK